MQSEQVAASVTTDGNPGVAGVAGVAGSIGIGLGMAGAAQAQAPAQVQVIQPARLTVISQVLPGQPLAPQVLVEAPAEAIPALLAMNYAALRNLEAQFCAATGARFASVRDDVEAMTIRMAKLLREAEERAAAQQAAAIQGAEVVAAREAVIEGKRRA